jgi:prepilin-type N-terminal cleavage/methylation domain-containing protein
MNRQENQGFTIIELLVVISIIALLASLLLPAVGKARDTALVSVSKSNLRQMAVAHRAYAADWADRHVTLVRDNIGLYENVCDPRLTGHGGSGTTGFEGHPPIVAGWGYSDCGEYVAWGYWPSQGDWMMFEPLNFPRQGNNVCLPDYGGLGWFRFGIQVQPMNYYFNNRYHDPVFYAPKDRLKLGPLEPCFEIPGEFAAFPQDCRRDASWTSYCLSPAGLFHPQVFSRDGGGLFWNTPRRMPCAYRVPSFGHVKYPTLKTHMLEHEWLQNAKVPCNATFTGCEPYYFNHSYQSMPVTLFYDGSVRLLGVLEAMSSDRRHERQAGHGLWTRDTPFGTDGYFSSDGYDFAETGFHILTTEGVRGRDTLGNE